VSKQDSERQIFLESALQEIVAAHSEDSIQRGF
jgi:hypothetical protein